MESKEGREPGEGESVEEATMSPQELERALVALREQIHNMARPGDDAAVDPDVPSLAALPDATSLALLADAADRLLGDPGVLLRSLRAAGPDAMSSSRLSIGGLLDISIDDDGVSAETPLGNVTVAEDGISVETEAGDVTVDEGGVSIDTAVGTIDLGKDEVWLTTPIGGIRVGKDGTVTVTGPDGATGGGTVPGTGGGFPFPTITPAPFEIAIPVPTFKAEPFEIPVSVPKLVSAPFPVPLSLPFHADWATTPSPFGPIPIPYPSIDGSWPPLPGSGQVPDPTGLFGWLGGKLPDLTGLFSWLVGNLRSLPHLPQPPSPQFPEPAPWLGEIRRAVARTVPRWTLGTYVEGGTIHGAVGLLVPGALKSDVDFGSTLATELETEQMPQDLAGAVATVLSSAWDDWFRESAGMLFYPAFAAFPAPAAPPMPNVPMPLIAALIPRTPGSMSPGALGEALVQELHAVDPDGDWADTGTQVSLWFSSTFVAWCASAVVINVIGSGPIPTYTPPVIPVGPVQAGTMMSGRGVVVGTGPFSIA